VLERSSHFNFFFLFLSRLQGKAERLSWGHRRKRAQIGGRWQAWRSLYNSASFESWGGKDEMKQSQGRGGG
jgi:hypothetical protein